MNFRTLLVLLVLFGFNASAQPKWPVESVVQRFLRYVQIDTQSDDTSLEVPTSENQREFAKLLLKELKALGVSNARLSDSGFIYALLPANLANGQQVPAFGLIAHLDTSPEVSGKNVKPIIHANYQGGDIVLPADVTQVIRVHENPVLNTLIGDDIITADGTTLLGADDKSGVAAIMTMIAILQHDASIKHGDIAIAFTPDEETSMGIAHFEVKNFGAKVAYTVDGGTLGNITNETWHAREAKVNFVGKSAHTGKAKGAMVNSTYAAAHFLNQLPLAQRPENSSGRQGFIHPDLAKLTVSESNIAISLRDFTVEGLNAKAELLQQLVEQSRANFPQTLVSLEITDNYRNMYDVIKHYPQLIKNAEIATERAGLTPLITAARWGTDGSSLSFMGLPCPDIFTGGHNFHSKLEFNSRSGLEKTTETLIHLSQVFVEQALTH